MIVCMLLYSSIALSCCWVDSLILSGIFDAEQSRVVSVRSYVLSFYLVRYTVQNDVYIFMTRSVSNAVVEIDRSII